ncbi:hypothetical protein Hanom_Chr11g00977761 [Helianthus anomalus]
MPDLNEVIVPSGDHGYGCPDYEAGYGALYVHEEYGNNFFVSGASCVQQDVGESSYTQESLVDEQPAYPEVSYKTDQVRMIYILLKYFYKYYIYFLKCILNVIFIFRLGFYIPQ